MTFLAKVTKEGNIVFDTKYAEFRFKMWCEKNHGKEVRIQQIKGKRSLRSNSLYWIWLRVIAENTGNDEDTLHRLFKGRFLPPKIVTLKGKEYKLARSTTELDTVQFAEYLSRVAAEAAELGIHLPSKEEAEKYAIDNL